MKEQSFRDQARYLSGAWPLTRRDFLRLGGASLVGAAFLDTAGCANQEGAGGGAGGRTQIKYFHYFSEANGVSTMEELISEFEEEHPDVRVELQYYGDTEIVPNLQTALVGGNPPDLAQIPYSDWGYAVTLPHTDVKDLVGSEEELSKTEEGFYPSFLKSSSTDGVLNGLPHSLSSLMLFYNADSFREAGLDPEEPQSIWTFEQVREAAQRVVADTDKEGVYIFSDGDYWFISMVRLNGGEMLGSNLEPRFNGEEGVEALSFWQGLVQDGLHPNLSLEEALQAFLGGQIAMLISTSALVTAAKEQTGFDLRTAPVPRFPGNEDNAGPHGGSGIMNFAQDPQKRGAAWELMQFLTSADSLTRWFKGSGYLPPRQGLIDDPQYLGGWVEDNPLYQTPANALPDVVSQQPWPGEDAAEVADVVNDATAEILGGANVENTLDRTSERVGQLLPEN